VDAYRNVPACQPANSDGLCGGLFDGIPGGDVLGCRRRRLCCMAGRFGWPVAFLAAAALMAWPLVPFTPGAPGLAPIVIRYEA